MNEKSRLQRQLDGIAEADQRRENARSRLDDIFTITLFEPIKTTGELKSVFRFAYKGRDFAALSLSERTAAGLEICALMRRLTGLNFPVFIDNTESIANFDMSALPRQTVFLRMVKNAPLSVKCMNQAVPKAA